jgi:hypothetical protein
MVSIHPKPQFGKYLVIGINDAVTVAAICRIVIDRKSEKTIWIGRGWLRSKVPEQLRPAGNLSVAIAVQRQKVIIGIGRSCDLSDLPDFYGFQN